jgi:hypothetical protein
MSHLGLGAENHFCASETLMIYVGSMDLFFSPRLAYVLKWLICSASNVEMSMTREGFRMNNHQSTQSLSRLLWKFCLRRKTTSSTDALLKVAGLENSPPTPPANSSGGRLFTYFVITLSVLL